MRVKTQPGSGCEGSVLHGNADVYASAVTSAVQQNKLA